MNMGLSAFQAKYTSEDNESFNKILDKQNAKRADKYRWLWNGNKLPSKQMIAQAAHRQKLLSSSASTSDVITTNSNAAKALTVTEHQALSQNLDDRGAIIATAAPPNPRNSFMFTPDPLNETHPEHQTRAEAAQAASLAGPRAVAYANTRLPTTLLPNTEDSIPPSPSLSAIDAAIAGRVRHRADSTIAGSVVPGSETPRVNGWTFVDAEATPSELGISDDVSTQPTQSNLLQQLIADNSLSSGGFTIADPKKRESLHHRLVEKTLASKRRVQPLPSSAEGSLRAGTLTPVGATPSLHSDVMHKLENGGRTPTPRFASSPVVPRRGEGAARKLAAERGGLTPAARQLYNKLGKTPTRVGSGGSFEGSSGREAASKGAWTPTPLRVRRAA